MPVPHLNDAPSDDPHPGLNATARTAGHSPSPRSARRPRGASLAAGVLLAAASLAPRAAWAEQPLWELGVGLGALHLPHYRGSDQTYGWVLPLPFAVYRGEILKADREGARAVLAEGERIDLDISLAAAAPTRSQDNQARAGMADLAPVIEFGPNLNLMLARGAGWKTELRLPLRAGFTVDTRPSQVGWIAMPRLALDLDLARWQVGAYASLVYGDRGQHGYYYDVAAAEATPDRPAYRAAGGYAGTQLTFGTSRRFERHWFGAFLRYDNLKGAAFADSPLVRRRDNLTVGVAMSWVLAQSERRVDDER